MRKNPMLTRQPSSRSGWIWRSRQKTFERESGTEGGFSRGQEIQECGKISRISRILWGFRNIHNEEVTGPLGSC